MIEVLLSLVILTSGLLVIVRSYYVAGKALERSQILFRSSLLIEEALFEPEARGAVNPEVTGGTCASDPGYAWSLKVSRASKEKPEKDLSLVELTLSSKERRPYVFTVATYLKSATS